MPNLNTHLSPFITVKISLLSPAMMFSSRSISSPYHTCVTFNRCDPWIVWREKTLGKRTILGSGMSGGCLKRAFTTFNSLKKGF